VVVVEHFCPLCFVHILALRIVPKGVMPPTLRTTVLEELIISTLPFMSRNGQDRGRHSFGHNSPAARARELFKPSMDATSLVVKIEKKIFVLGLSFSGGNITSRSVFALFWSSLPGPGCRLNGPLFGLKI